MRWVHQFGPELDKRISRYLRPTTDSYRVDETYIQVNGKWTYLYRAVDSTGKTVDFMLSSSRDVKAANRFFRKALPSPHDQAPRVITVDKNPAYPPALQQLNDEREIPQATSIRQTKYLNNIVEQDHRFIKITNPMMGFKSFQTAYYTLKGIKAIHIIRKEQVKAPHVAAFSITDLISDVFTSLHNRTSTILGSSYTFS